MFIKRLHNSFFGMMYSETELKSNREDVDCCDMASSGDWTRILAPLWESKVA